MLWIKIEAFQTEITLKRGTDILPAMFVYCEQTLYMFDSTYTSIHTGVGVRLMMQDITDIQTLYNAVIQCSVSCHVTLVNQCYRINCQMCHSILCTAQHVAR